VSNSKVRKISPRLNSKNLGVKFRHKAPHGVFFPAKISSPAILGFWGSKTTKVAENGQNCTFSQGKKQEMPQKRRPGPHEDPKPPKTSQHNRNEAMKHMPHSFGPEESAQPWKRENAMAISTLPLALPQGLELPVG